MVDTTLANYWIVGGLDSWWFLVVLQGFLVIVDESWWYWVALGGFWGAFVFLVVIGGSWLF